MVTGIFVVGSVVWRTELDNITLYLELEKAHKDITETWKRIQYYPALPSTISQRAHSCHISSQWLKLHYLWLNIIICGHKMLGLRSQNINLWFNIVICGHHVGTPQRLCIYIEYRVQSGVITRWLPWYHCHIYPHIVTICSCYRPKPHHQVWKSRLN